MTSIVQFPARYTPAVEIARWATDFIAFINETRANVARASLQREIESEIAFLARRWDASSVLVFEYLEASLSTEAIRLFDTLLDCDEILHELVRAELLPGDRCTAEVLLLEAVGFLEIGAARALKLTKVEGRSRAFIAAFAAYREWLVNVSVPQLTKKQRRQVFKTLSEIDDLHSSVLFEI